MALDPKRFIAMFVADSRDNLSRLNDGLAALNALPIDPETINSLFRAAHTIKGSARMLKLNTVTDTAHHLEEVLGALREGRITPNGDLTNLLSRAADHIAGLVDKVADGLDLPPADGDLCAALLRAAAPDTSPAAAAEPEPPPPPQIDVQEAVLDDTRLKMPDTVRVQLSKLDDLIKMMGEMASSHNRLLRRLDQVVAAERSLKSGKTDNDDHRLWLHQFINGLRDDTLSQSLLMKELGASALSMRMLPLSWAFEPSARMVRDLGRSLGKPVDCVVSGAEIELDRQMIDRLSDPLVHILRNSVDHGIEKTEDRLAAGKPAHGKIQLSARQDGAAVIIEIGDDGGGIPIDRIRDKAIQRGLIDVERAATLSEAQLIDLIFLPGLSTSAIITDLSGRGVGMDVVKKTIVDELRGVVTVDTRAGLGTIFRLRLPLTLAMMRVLICQASGTPLGFTAQYVTELVRVHRDELREVAGGQAMVLRNEFVHVVSLAALLRLPDTAAKHSQGILAVVVHAGAGKLALVIDSLRDERDMVIKPLPPHMAPLTLVSGMVVSGHGELVNILHVPRLIEMAKVLRGESVVTTPSRSQSRHARVLVVDDSLNTREIEKEVLESQGFVVTLAEDGLDGWQKAMAGDYEAVLTDVEMPGLDGFGLTRKLRGHAKYQDTPIIIITSRDKEEDRRRGIEVGADAYIVKGDFNQTGLVDTLRSLLG